MKKCFKSKEKKLKLTTSGFTLIELLAVIVILAVIALIATPLIMNTINDAKDSSMQRSVQNIQHSVENHVMAKKTLNTDYKFSMNDFDYKGEKYDKMNIVFNEFDEAGVAVYKDNKCFYILAGSSTVEINSELEEFECLTSVGVTIGVIAEQLLANNTTYSYMDGTYLKGLKLDFFELMEDKFDVSKEILRERVFDSNGNFDETLYDEFVCLDPDYGYGFDSLEDCYSSTKDYAGGDTMFEYEFDSTSDDVFSAKAIQNNYVWYNGFIWRIMGKNSDGSIRLITEENVTTIPWGANGTAQNYGTSYVKDWLNTYFIKHLKDTSGIVDSYFCEEPTVIDYNSKSTAKRTTCSNPVKAKAGLISLDELNMAGRGISYLFNNHTYWSLTPKSTTGVWAADYKNIITFQSITDCYGVRVVISVDPSILVTEGNGTLSVNADTEYVLGQTLDEVSGTLKDKSGSGEYVTFDGKLYRIVGHTANGTKLILDGLYADSNGNHITTTYGTSGNMDTMFSTMKKLLTGNDFLTWLAPTRSNEIKNTTWYRGEYWTGGDYKNIFKVDNQTNGFESKIGLIHVGEMLAGQSLSMVSDGYNATYGSVSDYWALTPYSTSNAWIFQYQGRAFNYSVGGARRVRPVIYISSDIEILGGNGTMSNPYEL